MMKALLVDQEDMRPIPRIMRERNIWLGAMRLAEEQNDESHRITCFTVANRLAWVLAVLGVDVID